MKHILEIKPAIAPEIRHKLENVLKEHFRIIGGGTYTDHSACDISFESIECKNDTQGPAR